MRVGLNPRKDQRIKKLRYQHHVVLPVCIPSDDGYFRDAFQILQLCLRSLAMSSHPATMITVVNNGSTREVANYLDGLLKSGKIHEVIHTKRIGKVNAVLKGIAGHNFPLVTISDADVLFLTGWQEAGYLIFDAFPKAGAVCTTPLSRRLRYFTENIYFDLFCSRKLRFTDVADPDAMRAFARSIGQDDFLQEVHLKKNLTVTFSQKRAIVGAGHFCCTYKGDIFNQIAGFAEGTFAGGEAVTRTIDQRVAEKGYWRLSTEYNYTYHLGNILEPWMSELLQDVTPPASYRIPSLPTSASNQLMFTIKHRWLPKLCANPWIWRNFLRWKGLDAKSAAHYF